MRNRKEWFGASMKFMRSVRSWHADVEKKSKKTKPKVNEKVWAAVIEKWERSKRLFARQRKKRENGGNERWRKWEIHARD